MQKLFKKVCHLLQNDRLQKVYSPNPVKVGNFDSLFQYAAVGSSSD